MNSLKKQITTISDDVNNRITVISRFKVFGIKSKVDTSTVQEIVLKTPRKVSSIHTRRLSQQQPLEDEQQNAMGQTQRDGHQVEGGGAQDVGMEEHETVLACQQYFKQLEARLNEKTAKVRELYDSIGPILVKLESLVLGTFTGRSDRMQKFYHLLERKAFSSLFKCVIIFY